MFQKLFTVIFLALTFSSNSQAEDTKCPNFEKIYTSCEIRFGRPDFKIDSFSVKKVGDQKFEVTAQSNQGELPFSVIADRVVRLGQDQRVNEDGSVDFFKTHESSFCTENSKIVGHQMVLLPDSKYEIQVLEFIKEGDNFVFKLTTNGQPRADVLCQP